jgi:hypothetical protein
MLVHSPDEDALRHLATDPTFADAAERFDCTVILIEDATVLLPPPAKERG